MRRFGRSGVTDSCLRAPSGLALHDEKLYVAECENHRVSVFSLDGKYLYCFGGSLLDHPGGVAMDCSGMLFVCDTGNDCLHLY